MEKKLYRSRSDKMLTGVCGGLAKYLNMDVTIVRLLAVASGLFVGGSLILYIAAALIIPQEPEFPGVNPADPSAEA